MNNTETVNVFRFNNRVIHLNADDVTHEESLASHEGGGNSMNWVLGHMIVSRDDIFELLGLEKVCDENMNKLYERGTENVNPDTAVKFDTLLKMFDDSQKTLEDKLSEADFKDSPDKLKSITFLAFHEAYHCGQSGLLRRIAGKEGAIK